MKYNTHNSTILRWVDIEVQYTYHRARRGSRDSLGGTRGAGPPLEPDEPEKINIESVTELVSGDAVELNREEHERIAMEIMDTDMDKE
jgi:hypothetical protein